MTHGLCPSTCPRLPDEQSIGLTHRFVEANGVRFHLVEAGQGPLVLMLHGFPEFWYSWRRQLPALAQQFRVVAPDLRGYNLSEKPADGYDQETLASDVPALIRALGAERAHVVGHDWGGVIAWGAALRHPEVVDKLVVLNAPHPAAYIRELRQNPRQLLKSWYIGWFQIPGVAEWSLTRNNGQGTADMFRRSTIDERAFPPEDLAAYRRAVMRPGAASAILAYYRTLRSNMAGMSRAGQQTVQAETLLIWGMQDVALVPSLTDDLEQWAPRLRVARIPDAGHWVQHERPDEVNRLLLDALVSG